MPGRQAALPERRARSALSSSPRGLAPRGYAGRQISTRKGEETLHKFIGTSGLHFSCLTIGGIVKLDNLLRAKAAIYAGFTILADGVGFPMEMIERVLVGGSFGKYINVEKAVQIGLLPDMPWENFDFLGNTSVKGSYLALIDYKLRQQITEIAAKMTYVELSADNKFYDAFMSAMFLPHTDMSLFPSVAEAMEK